MARAEIRRLVALFDESFFHDVTAPLLHEKMKKRLILRSSPDSTVLRNAMRLAHEHLDYIDWLVDNRRWLAGARAAAAKVLELEPANGRVQILLATLHFDANEKDLGRAALEKYLELEPNGAHVEEAKALLKR